LLAYFPDTLKYKVMYYKVRMNCFTSTDNSAGLLGQDFLTWLKWSTTLFSLINKLKITELQSRS